MNNDAVLLRRYAAERNDDAFAELVHRYLGLVYAAALRRLNGDSHGAADVTQCVFIKLARDASKLSKHTALAGWLYATTRNAAVDWVRVEQHRRIREQEVVAMQESVTSSEPEKDWQTIRPLLDATMDELDERDRTAILLRFFAGHRFADIGGVLCVSEDAARMRVERALAKLHGLLKRRGVTSSAAALGTVLTTQVGASAVTLPAGLMGSVTATALAGGATGVTAPLTATLGFMTTTKILLSTATVLCVAGFGAALYRHMQVNRAEAAVALTQREVGEPRTQVASDAARAVAFAAPTLIGADKELARPQATIAKVSISLPSATMDTVAKSWQTIFGGEVTIADRAESRKVTLQFTAPSRDEVKKMFIAALEMYEIYVIERPAGVMFDTEPVSKKV